MSKVVSVSLSDQTEKLMGNYTWTKKQIHVATESDRFVLDEIERILEKDDVEKLAKFLQHISKHDIHLHPGIRAYLEDILELAAALSAEINNGGVTVTSDTEKSN